MIRRNRPRAAKEPTIALINVVFLMLVFFLVAGTVAPPLESGLALVQTADLEGKEPPDAVVLDSEGAARYRGEPADLAAFVAALPDDKIARVVPDRNASAAELVALGRKLREAGAERVVIVTERGLE